MRDFVIREIFRKKIVNIDKDKNALFVWVREKEILDLKQLNFHSVLFGGKLPIKTKGEATKKMNDFLLKEYGLKLTYDRN